MIPEIKNLIVLFWFLAVIKNFLFWTWLWQLKEYHWGRFRAHFETGKYKKYFSAFWRFKLPKITSKVLILLILQFFLPVFFLKWVNTGGGFKFYFSLLVFFVFSPFISSILILLFQVPTEIFEKIILKKAARKREEQKELLVIGITGSYGKTSTKEFLATMLAEKYSVLKTEGHINSKIGIAQTILKKLNKEQQIFVVEMGAYEKGQIKEVCQMVRPQIGILTGINEQHLSTFGSLENIRQAKYELIESLPPNGLAVFNGGNKMCRELFEKTTNVAKIIVSPDEKKLKHLPKNLKEVDLENFLLAAAVAEKLGLGKKEIKKAVSQLESRLKTEKSKSGFFVIESTYSSNPTAVFSHLNYLGKWPGRKIIIMPCLIELGREAKRIHLKIGGWIAVNCDLAIITTGDYFKEIRGGAMAMGLKAEQILLREKLAEMVAEATKFAREGDLILLEGRLPKGLKDSLLNS